MPIWGIEAGDGSIFFFPEGALLYRDDRYEPLPYKSLKVAFSSGRFFEEEDLPDDATVVDSTWRFSRPDGSPDPRYKKDNVEIPVVLYRLLDISGPSGLKMRLMVSNRRAAARFARTFGAEDLREKRRKDSSAGAERLRARLRGAPPRRAEGSEEATVPRRTWRGRPGSPRRERPSGSRRGPAEEISAAYRELARTHHPDKVANLEPEVREYSEQRMKEINAAYAEFKRQWNEPATEETRAG